MIILLTNTYGDSFYLLVALWNMFLNLVLWPIWEVLYVMRNLAGLVVKHPWTFQMTRFGQKMINVEELLNSTRWYNLKWVPLNREVDNTCHRASDEFLDHSKWALLSKAWFVTKMNWLDKVGWMIHLGSARRVVRFWWGFLNNIPMCVALLSVKACIFLKIETVRICKWITPLVIIHFYDERSSSNIESAFGQKNDLHQSNHFMFV